MLAVMVARFPLATIYAGQLAWIPITLLVAFALGLVAYTVNAMIGLFKEEE